MTSRIFASVIVLVSIITMPYWVYLPVLFAAIVLMTFYWEGILFAFLIDSLYGSGMIMTSPFTSSYTLYVLAALIILLPFRGNFRFNV